MNFPEIHTDVGKKAKFEDHQPLRKSEMTVATPQHADARKTRETVQEKESANASGDQSFSKKQATELVREMEDKLREMNVNVSFNVHEDLDTVQVELRDGEGNVVKKIPSDELVKLSQNIKSGRLSGALDLNS
ncbi:flagellar protein FlaG [Salidesulfovibrio brasiliensis]|uniref:flagellar protein FlaG n=1 Tax=Salidesulfovibrio brasiliensis TaxID=221711 RepID=UPI0006D02A5C|nr:flagellar protein FlaG [Salidesulfovibrio brasiliensis]